MPLRANKYNDTSTNKLLINVRSILLLAGLALIPASANSEIYKYRDANGNWQFSDKPPASGQAVETVAVENTPEKAAASNLKAELMETFNPQSEIETATLAVVKIETPLGTGSGFFVSENGYLVTNKHVVRPPRESLNNADQQLDKGREWLQQRKQYIGSRRDYQQSLKEDLDDYADYVADIAESEKKDALKKYNRRKKQYRDYKADTDKLNREYKQALSAFTDQKNNYNNRRSSAMVARQFTVVLKNDTKLPAELVKLSEAHDLALLKVDGHRMPSVALAEHATIRQADKVYAIGSPLGRKDYITAGIVTSLRKDKIIMDAQILPGNSGGPLLNESSEVVGVNTWKQLITPGSLTDGFGVAIPTSVVEQEFGTIIKTANAKKAGHQVPSGKSDPDLMKSILEDYQKSRESQ